MTAVQLSKAFQLVIAQPVPHMRQYTITSVTSMNTLMSVASMYTGMLEDTMHMPFGMTLMLMLVTQTVPQADTGY